MTDLTHNESIVRRTAYHEAGHAVAAVVHGFNFFEADIRPRTLPGLGVTLGSAGLALPPPQEFFGKGEHEVMPLLIVLLSGFVAEQRIAPNAELDTEHRESDGQRAMNYAIAAICQSESRDGRHVITVEEANRKSTEIFAAIERAIGVTQEFTISYASEIDAVGELLEKNGVIVRSQVEQIIATTMEK